MTPQDLVLFDFLVGFVAGAATVCAGLILARAWRHGT